MLNSSPLNTSAVTRARGRPRTLPDAKCEKCGKVFRSRSSNANKFCSMKCMHAAQKAKSAWTAKRVARVRSMWNAGKTGEEIGKVLGVSRSSILGLARRQGFPAKRDTGGFALAPKPLPSMAAYIKLREERDAIPAPLSPDTITVEPIHLQSPPKPRLLTRWLVTNAVLAIGGGLAGAGVVIAGLTLAGYGFQ